MKKVLVTGGAGFIGSHVCEMYIDSGYEVICLDDLSSGTMENLDNIKSANSFHFEKCDIRDIEKVKFIFEQYRPHIINHHAAQKSVGYSVENPLYDLDVNSKGLLTLLECIKEFPIENFIYVSSGGALSKEIVENEKSCEEDSPQLVSPYAITKFAGEKYLELYSPLYKFNYTALRYANAYGPRQIPDGECGVIPIFLDNIFAHKKSILMTYDDMPKGCTRDYVYIDDIVKANKLVTQIPVNTVLNIGSGNEIAILDIYKELVNVFGSDAPIEKQGPRLGDVRRSVLDCERAKKLIGWESTYSLNEGLKAMKSQL